MHDLHWSNRLCRTERTRVVASQGVHALSAVSAQTLAVFIP